MTTPSRIRTTVCSLAVATLLGTATAPAAVAALNTAQIIASAVSQNCISWRVSGICYWLFCTPFARPAGNWQSGRSEYVGQRLSPFGVCQPDR